MAMTENLSVKKVTFAALCFVVLIMFAMQLKNESSVFVLTPISTSEAGNTNGQLFSMSKHSDEDLEEKYGNSSPNPSFRRYGLIELQTYQKEAEHSRRAMISLTQTPSSNGAEVEENVSLRIKGHETTCLKQIQLWAPFSVRLSDGEYECPAENCKARFVKSSKYDTVLTSHAVILHHKGSWTWRTIRRYRPEGQMWIYTSKESPIHCFKLRSPDPQNVMYNWTMTYRGDADFVIPYGRYTEDIAELSADDSRNWATGKTRLVAWMASNCVRPAWKRTKFVKRLQEMLQVDTYGRCGTLECPRNTETCDEILSSHKFYLALENSECEDYITEKFWKNALEHYLVPIVYGTTRKNYEKVAPPHSFIHLSDFDSMRSLAAYIKYLDKNDTAYNEYFHWRKRGSAKSFLAVDTPTTRELCAIVRKLKELDEMKKRGEERQRERMNVEEWNNCHPLPRPWSVINRL